MNYNKLLMKESWRFSNYKRPWERNVFTILNRTTKEKMKKFGNFKIIRGKNKTKLGNLVQRIYSESNLYNDVASNFPEVAI